MDVHSKGTYPANSLSNFASHEFELDGIQISSMEGFLQSLKFKSKEMQEEVCTLVGFGAKKKGSNKNWQRTQTLWWKGNPIKRNSKEYQALLDKAYMALYQNTKFRKALEASMNSTLTHSIGGSKYQETILTKTEFCSRLTKLRDNRTLIKSKSKKLL